MFNVNIMDLYGDSEDENSNVHNYEITHIKIDDLVLNEKNFYNTDDFEGLKENIFTQGLIQNLTVSEMEDGKYLILNGHRRFKAISQLFQEGRIEIDTIPCMVVEVTELEQRTMLIMANKTARELTPYEKSQEIDVLKEIITEVRKTKDESLKERLLKYLKCVIGVDDVKDIKGKTRDIVADVLNVSSSEVAKYEAINNNLTDEVKEEFNQGNINTNVAYETSKLDEEQQKEVKEMIETAKETESKVTANDVKAVREKHETIEEINSFAYGVTMHEEELAFNNGTNLFKVLTEESLKETEKVSNSNKSEKPFMAKDLKSLNDEKVSNLNTFIEVTNDIVKIIVDEERAELQRQEDYHKVNFGEVKYIGSLKRQKILTLALEEYLEERLMKDRIYRVIRQNIPQDLAKALIERIEKELKE